MISMLQPSAANPTAASRDRIEAAARQFESLALTELLSPMFATVDTSKGLFGGGDGEAAWKPLMVAELAKHIAAHGGLGLARPVMDQMIRIQEKQK